MVVYHIPLICFASVLIEIANFLLLFLSSAVYFSVFKFIEFINYNCRKSWSNYLHLTLDLIAVVFFFICLFGKFVYCVVYEKQVIWCMLT